MLCKSCLVTYADWQGLETRHRSKDLMKNELFLAKVYLIKKPQQTKPKNPIQKQEKKRKQTTTPPTPQEKNRSFIRKFLIVNVGQPSMRFNSKITEDVKIILCDLLQSKCKFNISL